MQQAQTSKTLRGAEGSVRESSLASFGVTCVLAAQKVRFGQFWGLLGECRSQTTNLANFVFFVCLPP